MPEEALTFWDKLISQYGHSWGRSRYITKDILRGVADWVHLGAEYQPPDANYRWNGLERVGDRGVIFQWTLEGEGMVRVGSQDHLQQPGQAFVIEVPGDNEYRIHNNGYGWKFLFVRIDDPWLTQRLVTSANEVGNTFAVSSSTRLGIETLRFFTQVFKGDLQDPFDADAATFSWSVELQRHIYQLLHPHDRRMELLESAQAFYRENRSRSFGVEDFSASIGMTRTRASVSFHKLTGKTLAAYFLELRLRDAVAMLGQGHKLQYIAQETGFSDANHLCKSFRRVYQTTPGQFRKMLGEKPVA